MNNEAESKEAQELFKQLGYKLVECHRVGMVAVNDSEIYPDVIGNWDEYNGKELTLPQLRDLVAQSKNEQGLISGADALRALADGKEVEYFDTRETFKSIRWTDAKGMQAWLFIQSTDGLYKFRLKPRTITLNVEIPAPFEPKVGEEYWFIADYISSGYGCTQEGTGINSSIGKWKSEEEIKQVVEALRTGIKG